MLSWDASLRRNHPGPYGPWLDRRTWAWMSLLVAAALLIGFQPAGAAAEEAAPAAPAAPAPAAIRDTK